MIGKLKGKLVEVDRNIGLIETSGGVFYQVFLPPALITNHQSLVHIDTWRMINPNSELAELDIKSLIADKTVLAIEWADKAIEEIKKYCEDAIIIWVKIEYPSKGSGQENDRLISWGNV